jgi:aspartyl-tRNA synthetase
MEDMKRTATCGELTQEHEGREVVLNGWVHRIRDHGGVLFINMRDRYGITQVVVDEDVDPAVRETAEQLKMEFCIAVLGTVRGRPENMVNREMVTGAIEVGAGRIDILSRSASPPFVIDERSEAREELRHRYRYLDLRSFSMQRKIQLRHEVTRAAREYLASVGFYEIETPTLIKSTPEGARDFLVPSRLHPGHFYALPQSPQLFKQILMISGFDRYFQIAHCFRDEDARGDRQLEHTQIDMEMSFVSKEDVFAVTEGMMKRIFTDALGIDLDTPFPRLSYFDAMNRFGTDRPDLRFDLELVDCTELARQSEFKVFRETAEGGGSVKALVAPQCGNYSRKQIEELESAATTYGAKGLAWMKVSDAGELEGGVSKFFGEQRDELLTRTGARPGDLLLFVADQWRTTCIALGAVRSALGAQLYLPSAAAQDFRFCWVTDFPLFEWNEEEEKWDPAHHMFTMPQAQWVDSFEEDPGSVKGDLYDLVCNGLELASGSIRIHDPALQKRVFDLVGFSKEEAQRRFGFLLEAFEYGPPPHGGIAPGLDRLVMLLAGESTIKEVIAFPKNNVGVSPMDGSPSEVSAAQLEELSLKIVKKETKNDQKS